MDQLFMCRMLPEDIEAMENSKQIDKDLKNAKKVHTQLFIVEHDHLITLFFYIDVGISTISK